MSPNSDNEGATRNGSAGRESLHDLPEHENIVEHFYDRSPGWKTAIIMRSRIHRQGIHFTMLACITFRNQVP